MSGYAIFKPEKTADIWRRYHWFPAKTSGSVTKCRLFFQASNLLSDRNYGVVETVERIIRPSKWHFYCSFLLVNNRFDGALLPISFHSSLHVHSWLIHCLFHPVFPASLLNLSSHWHIECNYLCILSVLTYVLVLCQLLQ